jgi:hypothetical protein
MHVIFLVKSLMILLFFSCDLRNYAFFNVFTYINAVFTWRLSRSDENASRQEN